MSITILLLSLTQAFAAIPKKAAPEVLLRYNYSVQNSLVCEGDDLVKLGEMTEICRGQKDGHEIVVRAMASLEGGEQIKVVAQVDRINSDGSTVELSRPSIVALDGEEASIEQGNEKESLFKFAVTPSIVHK
ncbi:MAG: hypothetical protein AB7F86_04530 [Bdellovibrionales bacterium]